MTANATQDAQIAALLLRMENMEKASADAAAKHAALASENEALKAKLEERDAQPLAENSEEMQAAFAQAQADLIAANERNAAILAQVAAMEDRMKSLENYTGRDPKKKPTKEQMAKDAKEMTRKPTVGRHAVGRGMR